MKKYRVVFLVAALLIFFSCASAPKGPTPAETMANKLMGTWMVSRFDQDKQNVIGTIFDSAKIDFQPGGTKSKNKLIITFSVSKGKIDQKLADWKKDYPDLVIDTYDVVVTTTWEVDKKAETVFFGDNVVSDLMIKGTGSNFEGFYGWEMTKFKSTVAIKSSGGLMGLVGGAVASKATDTSDYFPKISFGIGYWIKDLSANGFTLDNKLGGVFIVYK